MEAAAKTWNGEYWKKTGGGGDPWDSITFDAELNRIYIGTANAALRSRRCAAPAVATTSTWPRSSRWTRTPANTSGTTRSIREIPGITTARSR